MPGTGRRSPGIRLLLILAALASVILGYYLGQYWQRRPLAELAAEVYPVGRPLEIPAGVDLASATPAPWRLFLSVDTRDARCATLLRHYAMVINRLAAWPDIQSKLRLTLLAHDQPDVAARDAFTAGIDWVEVIAADRESLERLSAQLGLVSEAEAWCRAGDASAVLVSPELRQWALIPHRQAAIMAHNIRTIIAFVE